MTPSICVVPRIVQRTGLKTTALAPRIRNLVGAGCERVLDRIDQWPGITADAYLFTALLRVDVYDRRPCSIGAENCSEHQPKGAPFTSQIFDLYRPWLGLYSKDRVAAQRRSIARGEELFNNTNINITGVSGLNDDLNVASIPGFCGTCHDTPKVGNHSVKAPLDIGVGDAGTKSPPVLDISGLPVFTLTCTQGLLAGRTYMVTDPGRAMISGKCEDIGRFKGPILRGLASRAPYFHNGSAATLMDVVNFYGQRFSIGFTAQ